MRLAIRHDRAYGTRQKQAEPLNRPSVDRLLSTKVSAQLHRRITEADPKVPPPPARARRGHAGGLLEDRDDAGPLRRLLLARRGAAGKLATLQNRA